MIFILQVLCKFKLFIHKIGHTQGVPQYTMGFHPQCAYPIWIE